MRDPNETGNNNQKGGGKENTPILNLYPPPDGSAMHAHRHHHLNRLFKSWRPTKQMPLQSRKTWPQRPPNRIILKCEILSLLHMKSYHKKKADERFCTRSQPAKFSRHSGIYRKHEKQGEATHHSPKQGAGVSRSEGRGGGVHWARGGSDARRFTDSLASWGCVRPATAGVTHLPWEVATCET